MKRLIAAVSFAVLTVPAVAAESSKPFEQLDVDRALPQIEFAAVERSVADVRSLPYEQSQIDRVVPSFAAENVRFAAAAGSTMSDATSDAPLSTQTTASPFANDFNFIAPAQ